MDTNRTLSSTLEAVGQAGKTAGQVGVSYFTAWSGFDTLAKTFLSKEQNGYLSDHSVSFVLIFACVLVFMIMMPHFEAVRHPISVLMLASTLAGSVFVFMSQSSPKQEDIDIEVVKALMQEEHSRGSYLAKVIDNIGKNFNSDRILAIADDATINQAYGGLTPMQRAMRKGNVNLVKKIAQRPDVDPYGIGNSWRISPLNYVPFVKNWGTDNIDYALRLEDKKVVEPVLNMAVRRGYKFNKMQIGKMKRLKLDDTLIASAMGLYDSKLTTQLNNRLNEMLKD